VSRPAGTVVTVTVIPRAAKPGLAGTRAGALLVRLASPPVEGAANAELVELLASLLDIPKRAVTIVRGERSRTKAVRIDGVAPETIRQVLGL
jgi:hypothetical protein